MENEREELNKRRQEWEAEKAFQKKQSKILKIGFAVMLLVVCSCCLVMMAAVKGWFPFSQQSGTGESQPIIQTQPDQTRPVRGTARPCATPPWKMFSSNGSEGD